MPSFRATWPSILRKPRDLHGAPSLDLLQSTIVPLPKFSVLRFHPVCICTPAHSGLLTRVSTARAGPKTCKLEVILGPTSLALQIEAIPLSGRRLLTFEPCKVASVYSAIGLVLTETGGDGVGNARKAAIPSLASGTLRALPVL